MNADLDVDTAPEQPCARCGGPVLLTVRVPVPTTRADGHRETSWRRAALCPDCDRDKDTAQGVLAFFALHEQITPDTLAEAAPLLQEWARHHVENPPHYSDEELDEDIRRWHSGDI